MLRSAGIIRSMGDRFWHHYRVDLDRRAQRQYQPRYSVDAGLGRVRVPKFGHGSAVRAPTTTVTGTRVVISSPVEVRCICWAAT